MAFLKRLSLSMTLNKGYFLLNIDIPIIFGHSSNRYKTSYSYTVEAKNFVL